MYVPTNHIYVGDIFLLGKEDVIRTNLSVREGLGESLLCFLSFQSNSSARNGLSCTVTDWYLGVMQGLSKCTPDLNRILILVVICGWFLLQRLWCLWAWHCRAT